MTPFFLAATLLALIVLLLVVVPLFRVRRSVPAADATPALTALRRQRQEIEDDFVRGAITAEERETALADLVTRASEELPVSSAATPSPPPARTTRPWLVAAILALLVPAVALPLYLKLGTPAALDPAARTSPSPGHEALNMETAVDLLGKRMEQRPDDVEGWVLLARSRYALGRFPDAVAAFERANKLHPNDASLLADYADALTMAQNRSFAGKPRELVQQALQVDPHSKKALALAASAEMSEQHNDQAVGYWKRLLAEVPPDSEDAKEVTGIIAEIKSGGAKATAPVAGAKTAAAPTVASAATPAASITGKVSLAASLAAKASPDDTVFIYARAAEGPRMPLAIQRVTVKELPKEFALDDSMGMGTGPKLSETASIRVEARVSKSGNAVAQAGDLAGSSAAVKPGARNVAIVIDHAVQ